MSMVINLVEDHNIYLCEGGPVYNGGVQPTPITYLTQWKIVGNSEVHGVGNLTSWKVSGNSIVQDGVIMSCGDYSDVDGKYHVKISNGVDVYDIALTEPLRKVNDIADTIEFPSNTEGKALVTRNIQSKKWNTLTIFYQTFNNYDRLYTNALSGILLPTSMAERTQICLSADFTQNAAPTQANAQINPTDQCMCVFSNGQIYIRDTSVSSAEQFVTKYSDNEFLYLLATPTTELVDAPQIAVSPTDTYTSANTTPYSAFEYKKNVEIWSCGEYNATDGKYHILVQPQGGSIADIALDEPLRKVNDVVDTIEFPSGTEGKALVTRNILSYLLEDLNWIKHGTEDRYYAIVNTLNCVIPTDANTVPLILCNKYTTVCFNDRLKNDKQITAFRTNSNYIGVIDLDVTSGSDIQGVILLQLATTTTELVDAPQIEEADSYTCVISQGAKAVSWSSFETD